MTSRGGPQDPFPGAWRLSDLAQSMRDSINRSIEPFWEQQRRIEQIASQARKSWESIVVPGLRAMEGLRQAWLEATPDNWHELDPEELIIIDLVEQTGMCLIWVPRPEVLRALLESRNCAPYQTLADHTAEILDDLEKVLERARDVDVEGFADAWAFAEEAIASARAGHFRAAQNLAASGLGPVLHTMHGFDRLGEAYKAFEQVEIELATMRELKLDLLAIATRHALTDTDKVQAPAEGFNRHGTQHGNPEFFSQANALAGMMLLVGWLREFKWLAEHHPEVFRADNSA